jgi:hypothetical protein
MNVKVMNCGSDVQFEHYVQWAGLRFSTSRNLMDPDEFVMNS